jgi:hypothetical protein
MPTTLYVATRKDLFTFIADGAAWRLRDRHFIGDPVSAVLPDRRDGSLYAALNLGHFGVKLRRSRDGGASWQEIMTARPSSFGFAVAVHPTNADTAWFVPAVKDECRVPVHGHLVVTRTRDGGETFEVLSRGLPEPPTFDLVYRHGLDVAPDGVWLAMGSTTGSLWVSPDQGESWQCLSTHLPPIHAVRFD